MRKLPLRNTVMVLVLLPLMSRAHTTNMTTVTMTLAESGAFDMVVEFDPGEKMLGYPHYYEVSRMAAPERTAALAAITLQIEREMRVSFDGGRTLLQVTGWTLPNAPYESFVDTTTPTMSQVHIKGSAPAHAERLDFVYTAAIQLPTPLLFRVDKAGERLPFSRVVDGPDQPMRVITLLKPPPPLLSEVELRVAARIVHAAKTWAVAYASAIVLHWDVTVLAWLIGAMFVIYRGWREQFIAAATLGAVAFGLKISESPLMGGRWPTAASAALAVLAIVLGVVIARRKGSNGLWWVLALLAGALQGWRVATIPGAGADPVLSVNTVRAIEALGYAGAWLGAAVAVCALRMTLRDADVHFRRFVPASGCALAGVAVYWLVSVLRTVA